MVNQIKHNAPNHNTPDDVLSQFNPIVSLKPDTRKAVNERFILPILENFFKNKGGIDCFSELDADRLITEKEFVSTENFVQTYIYKEIIDEISKKGQEVIFKPKYVTTFDTDLADYKEENGIKYGVIRLGQAPILYYILLDLQQLIRFIKDLPEETEIEETNKIIETEEDKRNKLFDTVIFEKQRQLRSANTTQREEIKQEINRLEQVRQAGLEGQGGKLRVNLAWNSTDDLDLHIQTPTECISYKNKTVENDGIIGVLDVDKNASSDLTSNPQENINFNMIPSGLHKIFVNLFAVRESNEVPFTITIIPEVGEGRIFHKTVAGKGNNKDVVTFEFVNGILDFKEID